MPAAAPVAMTPPFVEVQATAPAAPVVGIRPLGDLIGIRPTAVGKKNRLFIGHPDAGRRAAILYSLIVSCLRHGKDPAAYLRDVLTRLPAMTNQNDIGMPTPRLWQPVASSTS